MSDIENLRNRIDEVTLEMIKLLKKRTEISKEIGGVKKNLGLTVADEAREKKLREKTVSLCHKIGLDESIGARFLNFLLNESVKVQSSNTRTHLSVFLKAKSLEEKGKNIIHMEVGEPDFEPPTAVRDALGQVYYMGFTKYGPPKGMPAFRVSLAKKTAERYNTKTEPENIIVCPGARFAVYLAITTLLNPGDEVIVIEPAWPAYRDCALDAGIKVRTIKTSFENRWEPSVQQIEDAINSNTKMLILNYPNNPTGKILPTKLQDEIVNIAIKNNLYVLSDEIYWQYAFSDWKSLLSYEYEKSIVTQSFSKSHSMTGFRIGYAVAKPSIIDTMAKKQALCLTNVSEPMQYVAMKALEANTSDNTNTIKSKLCILTQKAIQARLDFVKPDGAMYIFARIGKENFDATGFCDQALDHGLAIAPGEGFGDYRNFIRLSACQDEKKLIEGMNILENMLKDKA